MNQPTPNDHESLEILSPGALESLERASIDVIVGGTSASYKPLFFADLQDEIARLTRQRGALAADNLRLLGELAELQEAARPFAGIIGLAESAKHRSGLMRQAGIRTDDVRATAELAALRKMAVAYKQIVTLQNAMEKETNPPTRERVILWASLRKTAIDALAEWEKVKP